MSDVWDTLITEYKLDSSTVETLRRSGGFRLIRLRRKSSDMEPDIKVKAHPSDNALQASWINAIWNDDPHPKRLPFENHEQAVLHYFENSVLNADIHTVPQDTYSIKIELFIVKH